MEHRKCYRCKKNKEFKDEKSTCIDCREKQKKEKEYRKSKNLCTKCGKEKIIEEQDLNTCRECRNSRKIIKKRKYDLLKDERRCVSCQKKLEKDDLSTCGSCKEKALNRKKTKIKNKICIYCSKPTETDIQICNVCKGRKDKNLKEKRKNREIGGFCNKCGKNKKMDDGKLCSECFELRSKYRKERIKNNICTRCKCKSMQYAKQCFKHWLMQMSDKKTISENWKILKEIWETQNNGVCALTGEQLIPGINASIDHIIPVSQGGGGEKENLRWISLDINKFLEVKSDQDFFSLCLKVIQHNLSKIPNEQLSSLFSLLKQKLK